jgi:hypothetical protein
MQSRLTGGLWCPNHEHGPIVRSAREHRWTGPSDSAVLGSINTNAARSFTGLGAGAMQTRQIRNPCLVKSDPRIAPSRNALPLWQHRTPPRRSSIEGNHRRALGIPAAISAKQHRADKEVPAVLRINRQSRLDLRRIGHVRRSDGAVADDNAGSLDVR